jgi:hypothetical protein
MNKKEHDSTMKTDAFTLAVILVVIISIVTAGIIILITQNNLTSIPSVERGTIVSKNILNANDSVVVLSDGKTLHILNNTPLYMSLLENQKYVFNCFFNYDEKITIINSVQNDTS